MVVGIIGVILIIGLCLNSWIFPYLPAVAGGLLCGFLILVFPLYFMWNIIWIFRRMRRRCRCRDEWRRGEESVILTIAFRDGLEFSGDVKRKQSVTLSQEPVGEAVITLMVSSRGGTRKVVSGSIALAEGVLAKASFPDIDHDGVLILSSGSDHEPQAVDKALESKAKDCGCQPVTIAEAGWAAWESGTHDGMTEDSCRLTVAADGRSLQFEST